MASSSSLPTDSDGKATALRLFSLSPPHMLSFHLSWLSFFCSFASSFAFPPLLPILRDALSLTSDDITNAAVAAVSGSIFARLAVGTACDLVGPRLASAGLMLLTAPAVFLTATIDSAVGFVAARFFAGISLATFVTTQFWMSSMFSSGKVGLANGITAGWGNLGGGAVQLLMPLVFKGIRYAGCGAFTAWRIAFFIPGLMQVIAAILVLTLGQDMPEGNYIKLHKLNVKSKDNASRVIYHGVANYRGWVLALTYGYCFGVELAIDNIIAEYFYDRFHLDLRTAGLVGASFGLANVVSRPGGGWLSDLVARRFGMRGRLWGLWAVQTLGGALCLLLGCMSSLGASIAVMVLFSFFVQAACGLTFGVAPFISRRALGVVSGMTGAGGNVGAVVVQLLFFRGMTYTKEQGITYMGIMIMCCTLSICLIYFPQWGGMLCGPSHAATEEAYYLSEWTADERERDCHIASLRFAANSRGERCRKEGTHYAMRQAQLA